MLIGKLKLCGGFPLVAEALESESIRTRLSAIEAAANFPDDETVQLIAHSVKCKPDGYEYKKLEEWIIAMIEYQRINASSNLRNKDDLSLDNAAIRGLEQIGTPYALEHAARIIESSPELSPQIEQTRSQRVITLSDLVSVARSAAREVTIYSLPNDIRVWIESQSDKKDDGDIVYAVTIHGDGTLDIAMGPRDVILRDIVSPYLRGEKPELRGSEVKQGEFKTMSWGSPNQQEGS